MRNKPLRWTNVLGTLVMVGGLAVFALLATGRHEEVAIAAPAGATPGVQATVSAVARRTEQLHLAHAQRAATVEDENGPPSTAAPKLISPEQAVAVIQTAAPANNSAVVWVALETDANGQPVYIVRIGGPNGRPILVDARTGRILPSVGR